MLLLALSGPLRPLDWLVLAAYAALIVAAGFIAQRRAKAASARDYFLAGGAMPVWAVIVSTLATAQSAATFVGVPQDAYDGNLTYLSANIGGVLAALILAAWFIPAYYRLGVATPYELLERRFGPGAKLASSCAYMLGRVFASGARIYVGAIPITIAFFGERSTASLAIVIAIVMVFAILFTLRGGLESVIWTDVVQVGVYVGAALVTLVLLFRAIPAPLSDILAALQSGGPNHASKLTVIKSGLDTTKPLGFDPAAPFTLLTACTGWLLLNLAAFGTDQDLVQRLLSCKSARQGARSVMGSMLAGIPVVALFASLGLLLWVVYNRPDLMGRPTPAYIAGDTADVFLKFVLHELPGGAAGLVIAGVLAAGPAGINASLNSMAGTFISDVYRPSIAPGRSDAHYVRAGRFAVVAWGLILGLFALACIWWQASSGDNVISFVLNVMGFAYAGLLAVFLTALFTRRGTTASAIAAMATGFVVVLLLNRPAFGWWTSALHLDWTAPAGPWRMLIGTLLATCVAALPRGRAAEAAA